MKVEITFPDLKSLWAFEATMEGLPLNVNTNDATLQRICTFDQIHLARQLYNATEVKVIRRMIHDDREVLLKSLSQLAAFTQKNLLTKLDRLTVNQKQLTKVHIKKLSGFVSKCYQSLGKRKALHQ